MAAMAAKSSMAATAAMAVMTATAVMAAKSSMAAVATKPSEMKAPPVAVDPNHQYSAFNNFKGAHLFVVI